VKVLGAGPGPRADRYASALVHDEPNARIVAFHLAPGQSVPPHTSESTVLVQVTEGHGTFSGADGAAELSAGESAVYAPGELHGIDARDVALRFLAVITPRPGG
jgi:quercetin dioxygenase-like cupin family protein